MPPPIPCKLFQPVRLSNLSLSHRIVLAPMTRMRAKTSHVPHDIITEYYSQRASTPGSLLISEGVLLSSKTSTIPHVPRIWTEDQIQGWKKVADAVHDKGCFVYMQLWTLGRAAKREWEAAEDSPMDVVGPSDIPFEGGDPPRPLTIPELREFVEAYRTAAINAVDKAGCDGVEIHMANGYLMDQFLQDVSNVRTDQYGGSIENRCRFPLEVVEAVVQAVGQEKVAVRVSPWNTFQGMRMKDPIPTFSHFISRIRDMFPRLSYVHAVEPSAETANDSKDSDSPSNDFIREIWQPRPFISAGDYTRESAMRRADQTGELIAFARLFISNPDLPLRLQNELPLAESDRTSWYAQGPKGYTDYPFAKF